MLKSVVLALLAVSGQALSLAATSSPMHGNIVVRLSASLWHISMQACLSLREEERARERDNVCCASMFACMHVCSMQVCTGGRTRARAGKRREKWSERVGNFESNTAIMARYVVSVFFFASPGDMSKK